jgi:hypothetical protein
MRELMMVLALAGLALSASAQNARPAPPAPDHETILAVLAEFFDANATRNPSAAEALLLPDGVFVYILEGYEGPVVGSFTARQHVSDLAAEERELRQRVWDPVVRVHGRIATVWTPYDYWSDGEFSHCGVDVFNLVKTDSGWKIAGALYTVEMSRCAPSPLGPLAGPVS